MAKKYLKEVENEIKKISKGYPKPQASYYNTELEKLAVIPSAVTRKLAKDGFSFKNLAYDEKLKIWDYIWHNSNVFGVLSQALHFFEYDRKKNLTLSDWKIIKPWSKKIENWVHSDMISSWYAILHEKYPKEIYPTFEKWNKSELPWQRRLSIIGLYYYSDMRKKHPSFSKSKKLILNLVDDDHFYVQKAVGWALRETYNVYPEKTYELLKKLASKIPPAGWQAATEKLNKANKKLLKELRSK